MKRKSSYYGLLLLGALALTGLPGVSHGQDSVGKIEAANPGLQGDGTLGPSAAAAMLGPLPLDEAEATLKRNANRASQDSMRSGPLRPAGSSVTAESGGNGSRPSTMPTIVADHSFAGIGSPPANKGFPANVTGAIGPQKYIQAANDTVRIYGRRNHHVVATGGLNRLAGLANSVKAFNPQIMWDPTTERFYYVTDAVFSAKDNRLAFGFSRTSDPHTLSSSDWCQYTYKPANGSRFPDYPKLGDSRHFIIIGVNSYKPNTVSKRNYVGSDLIAISKPKGKGCPAAHEFKTKALLNLKDTNGDQVFTPVPANQVDDNDTGYVVARGGNAPFAEFWFFDVTRGGSGIPLFGAARKLDVPLYEVPPDAAQPDFHQSLETLDARPTQAVQAINPRRAGEVHSFWMQHTVKNLAPDDNTERVRSVVRWYEINPAPATPVLLQQGRIGSSSPDNFYFNAAISPDRRKDGRIERFGGSFVIGYNVSSRINSINPRIVAGSSVDGDPMTFLLIQNGVDGYKDATCPQNRNTCRWSNYSSASPDPRPTISGRGQVWGTNQFSGQHNSSSDTTNFRSWIFGLHP